MNLILGAGMAGLSCSHHLGHEHCVILEKTGHLYGHVHSEVVDGFTWDEGPHVSFTNYQYVRDLFAASVEGAFEDYPVRTRNYFRGEWIDHPAQSNLYQVPEPLRAECLRDFLATHQNGAPAAAPENYQQWLEQAFGPTFANNFPAAYTRKYWTVEPKRLTTAWVGPRVFRPKVEDVLAGAEGPLSEQTHYIKTVRYPSRGGYQSFARKLAVGADVRLNTEVARVDLRTSQVTDANGTVWPFTRLVNTLPLPVFIACCTEVPPDVREAAAALVCSEVLLVNITAPHPTRRDGNWFYIYDEDKFSTRINCTEVLSPHNAPVGHTGVQVEVYSSHYRRFSESIDTIVARVVSELVEMGFIDGSAVADGTVRVHPRFAPWANVIFDHSRESALDCILRWLESQGLAREADDLAPITDWDKAALPNPGPLVLAGRFGQWRYYWSDDCVLRGKIVADGCRS